MEFRMVDLSNAQSIKASEQELHSFDIDESSGLPCERAERNALAIHRRFPAYRAVTVIVAVLDENGKISLTKGVEKF
jgi:hypothetical protein